MTTEPSADLSANLQAYADVETPDLYDPEALLSYRESRLQRARPCIDFIRQHSRARRLAVAEVGSGSSALLYGLELAGKLARGLAIEFSRTRHEFAEVWRRDGQFRFVTNVCGDFAAVDMPADAFDALVVVDNTFSYLQPENAAYPSRLLEKARRCLRNDGLLVLEVENYLDLREEESRTLAVKLDETNPFRSASYRLEYDALTNSVRKDSVYVLRSGEEKRKVEFSFVYSPEELTRLLEEHGFMTELICGDFGGGGFGLDSKAIVVAARLEPAQE